MSFFHPIPHDELPPRGLSPLDSSSGKRSKPAPTGPPSPCPEPSYAPPPPPPQNWKLPPPSDDRSLSPAPPPRPQCESSAEMDTESCLKVELARLKDSIKRAFILDDQGNVSLGSLRRVEEAEKRMYAWCESTCDEDSGYVINYHFKALSMMMKAFKGYYFGFEEDFFVIYSLFQSSIFAFWVAMQSFQNYRPKRMQIDPKDLPKLDVPKEFQQCRNNLAHQNEKQHSLVELSEQTAIAYAWYTRNFWPNLSFEYEENDNVPNCPKMWYLILDMNFPKLNIRDETDWLYVNHFGLFKVLAKEGF